MEKRKNAESVVREIRRKTNDVTCLIDKAIERTQAIGVKINNMPKLLSDNGSCHISERMKEYTFDSRIEHIRSVPYHPMTQGKYKY